MNFCDGGLIFYSVIVFYFSIWQLAFVQLKHSSNGAHGLKNLNICYPILKIKNVLHSVEDFYKWLFPFQRDQY